MLYLFGRTRPKGIMNFQFFVYIHGFSLKRKHETFQEMFVRKKYGATEYTTEEVHVLCRPILCIGYYKQAIIEQNVVRFSAWLLYNELCVCHYYFSCYSFHIPHMHCVCVSVLYFFFFLPFCVELKLLFFLLSSLEKTFDSEYLISSTLRDKSSNHGKQFFFIFTSSLHPY